MSSERRDATQKHVSDMLATERHILQALRRQRETDEVRNNVEANQLIIKIERAVDQHVAGLEALTDQEDADLEAAAKKAMTSVLGVAAGLYDKIRTHKLSRMLRDNYTALSLAAMAYTTMHSFGLAINDQKIADIALKHLKDYTPLLVEISKQLPSVTIREMTEVHKGDFAVDTSAIQRAVDNTQEAWSPRVTESA